MRWPLSTRRQLPKSSTVIADVSGLKRCRNTALQASSANFIEAAGDFVDNLWNRYYVNHYPPLRILSDVLVQKPKPKPPPNPRRGQPDIGSPPAESAGGGAQRPGVVQATGSYPAGSTELCSAPHYPGAGAPPLLKLRRGALPHRRCTANFEHFAYPRFCCRHRLPVGLNSRLRVAD